jgi:hypothetical protein
MGFTWEVSAWLPQERGGYDYEHVYGGRSIVRAIRAMRRAKRSAGCVRLEWR